MKSCFAI